MRTRTKATGFLVVIVACLAFVALLLSEPKYNGKGLSFWITSYHAACLVNMNNTQARDAIRAIGPEAVPYLRKWARYIPPAWPAYLPRGPCLLVIRVLNIDSRTSRSDAAVFAFSAFDTNPNLAISELKPLMQHSPVAFDALARLGDAGLPTLLSAWSNASDTTERWMIEDAVVSHLPADARNTNLVPLLLKVVSSGVSERDRTRASNALFQIAPAFGTNAPMP